MNFNVISTILFKPYFIGILTYILYIIRFNSKVTIIEILLTILLIYQISILIELFINSFTCYSCISDNMMCMSDNNTQNNFPNDNIPRHRENPDYPKIIRYLCTNIAALAIRKPTTRLMSIALLNASNVVADIMSNEERANYWLDQFDFYRNYGRFRGEQSGTGPFERGTNPFDYYGNNGGPNGSGQTCNFTSNFDFDFLRDFLSPVDHSIPLDTLINVHFLLIVGLFIMVIGLIVITIYSYINLIILFNKDYFLNRVKNKYVLMYVKYIVFKSRIDIIVISIITLGILCHMAYILHYLIIHPIINFNQ